MTRLEKNVDSMLEFGEQDFNISNSELDVADITDVLADEGELDE